MLKRSKVREAATAPDHGQPSAVVLAPKASEDAQILGSDCPEVKEIVPNKLIRRRSPAAAPPVASLTMPMGGSGLLIPRSDELLLHNGHLNVPVIRTVATHDDSDCRFEGRQVLARRAQGLVVKGVAGRSGIFLRMAPSLVFVLPTMMMFPTLGSAWGAGFGGGGGVVPFGSIRVGNALVPSASRNGKTSGPWIRFNTKRTRGLSFAVVKSTGLAPSNPKS